MSARRAAVTLSVMLGFFSLSACAVEVADTTRKPRRESVAPGTQGPGSDTAPPDDATGPATNDALSANEAPPAETPADDGPAPAKKVLELSWAGQETYYWCGPGSTRMALSTRMQAPPTQTELANFMGTTTSGTDHVGLVVKALNKFIDGAGYKTREISDPPTDAQRALLKQDIVARIGKGYPIVANVVSGWRPPTYPDGTIYHYVSVLGYDENGAKVMIADPAAEGKGGGPKWEGVPRTYWISLDELATWVGGKGYTG